MSQISLYELIPEDLRKWFGKGDKGGVGGGGWDRYNSSGDRVGKCGDAKEGDAYSACLSKEKARKLGKAGRAAFVKRKRAAQTKGGDAKKGNERSKGQKPIKVKTGVSESRDIETAYSRIDNLPKGSTFEDAKRIDSIFKKSKHTWSETIEAFEKNEKDAEIKLVNIKDIRITQPNIQSNKVKAMIDNFDTLPTVNAVQFSDELVIYDGHHRLLAAWTLNEPKIKVNLVTLDDISVLKEADDSQAGKSAPYGSGYKKVNEIGESSAQPYKYKLNTETYYKVEYTFTTDSGLDYMVKFDLDDDMADVVFLTRQSLDVARSTGKNAFLQTFNKGELYKVMATVTSIVKEFLEKYTDIETLVLSPSKEDDTDNRRTKLYLAFIKKNIDSDKYSFDENRKEIIITRKPVNEARVRRRKLVNELNLFLEKNVPTDPEKWSYAKAQAKKKYDVYPSAYANAWAAKKYKELGGGWKKGK